MLRSNLNEILVFMAVVIGSMVLALYLPMFEAFSALQSRGGP